MQDTEPLEHEDFGYLTAQEFARFKWAWGAASRDHHLAAICGGDPGGGSRCARVSLHRARYPAPINVARRG